MNACLVHNNWKGMTKEVDNGVEAGTKGDKGNTKISVDREAYYGKKKSSVAPENGKRKKCEGQYGVEAGPSGGKGKVLANGPGCAAEVKGSSHHEYITISSDSERTFTPINKEEFE
ncbi:unnamed protein product [Vicia faba]|uniref:Uncharacterized protein n=1 Tax=Vicia faba TaxID=3906 RepID=A0AAV1B347_VICFA|nr:unnamed protein product [Vicia faba]